MENGKRRDAFACERPRRSVGGLLKQLPGVSKDFSFLAFSFPVALESWALLSCDHAHPPCRLGRGGGGGGPLALPLPDSRFVPGVAWPCSAVLAWLGQLFLKFPIFFHLNFHSHFVGLLLQLIS